MANDEYLKEFEKIVEENDYYDNETKTKISEILKKKGKPLEKKDS